MQRGSQPGREATRMRQVPHREVLLQRVSGRGLGGAQAHVCQQRRRAETSHREHGRAHRAGWRQEIPRCAQQGCQRVVLLVPGAPPARPLACVEAPRGEPADHSHHPLPQSQLEPKGGDGASKRVGEIQPQQSRVAEHVLWKERLRRRPAVRPQGCCRWGAVRIPVLAAVSSHYARTAQLGDGHSVCRGLRYRDGPSFRHIELGARASDWTSRRRAPQWPRGDVERSRTRRLRRAAHRRPGGWYKSQRAAAEFHTGTAPQVTISRVLLVNMQRGTRHVMCAYSSLRAARGGARIHEPRRHW
mmetsp:Transcript_1031/g.2293  ORF Transcript_1031/g.2293 Transcript_1031/m.2293 type:complete len:301 (-) Transcript_1031:125-1027(-)